MAQLDLNLIPTFLLLYETRSATRTAEELSLTQPAVSHALGRLRRHFNDRLFNRSPGGLQPTELATTIYPTLRQAIEVIDTTVRGAGRFDPTTSRRTFRLHATDLGEINLLPAVLRLIADTAPHIDLHVEPLNFSVVEDRLRQGRADAAICTPPITAPDVDRDLIRRDSYCGICSADHPRIGNEPTLDDFLAERHIAVEVTTGHTDVDHALASLGHVRDVALRISHFAALPHLIEQTRYLSIIPRSVADQFLGIAPVKTFELPFDVPAVEISLYTYKRVLPDPGIAWFRHAVRTALSTDIGTA
ncbi:MAG: LysR family transcriptional regulator [Rhodococcus sp. (in: high G+C Gram-positive bacteria)]|uniref:LysR family transcriptional regulator n=1 Tax=Rhodococcus sp. TaxID=1831 RepID=UPI003BB79632